MVFDVSPKAPWAQNHFRNIWSQERSQGLTGDSSPVKYNARELLNTGSHIGTLLERLHSKFPDHVYSKRTAKNRY